MNLLTLRFEDFRFNAVFNRLSSFSRQSFFIFADTSWEIEALTAVCASWSPLLLTRMAALTRPLKFKVLVLILRQVL